MKEIIVAICVAIFVITALGFTLLQNYFRTKFFECKRRQVQKNFLSIAACVIFNLISGILLIAFIGYAYPILLIITIFIKQFFEIMWYFKDLRRWLLWEEVGNGDIEVRARKITPEEYDQAAKDGNWDTVLQTNPKKDDAHETVKEGSNDAAD